MPRATTRGPRSRGLSWADVVQLAMAHPGVEQHTWFRSPALRVGKKSFARLKEDGASIVLLVDGDDAKEMLLASDPGVFFTTPHYDGYPYVLIRLAEVRRGELAPLVATAARLSSPKPRGRTARPDRAATVTPPSPGGRDAAAAPFTRVQLLVARIPRGRVTTYGQLSAAIDRRLTPVGVGWAIRAAAPGSIPWQRVVNARGGISTDAEHHGLQRSLLEAEGVTFDPGGTIDLARYGWSPGGT